MITHRFANASWTNLDWAAIGLERHVYRAWQKQPNSVNEPWLHGIDEPLGANLLITTGTIRKHTDAEELPPYSYHAIIRNDGFIARSNGLKIKRLPIQDRGTVIVLNIHEEHEVVRDTRIIGNDEFEPFLSSWVSLCFNDDALLTETEILARFNTVATKIEASIGNLIAP